LLDNLAKARLLAAPANGSREFYFCAAVETFIVDTPFMLDPHLQFPLAAVKIKQKLGVI
jgi:hypothetical protein